MERMNVRMDITAFISAALPWIAMGLLLAIFFARAVRGKKEKKKEENYGSEGTALGTGAGGAGGPLPVVTVPARTE